MIAGLQQQLARDAGRPPPSPLHFGRREPEPFDTFPPIEASSARDDEPTDFASTRDEPTDFETPAKRESLPPIDDAAAQEVEVEAAIDELTPVRASTPPKV